MKDVCAFAKDQRAVIARPFTVVTTAIESDSTDTTDIFDFIVFVARLTVGIDIGFEVPTPNGDSVEVFDRHFHN